MDFSVSVIFTDIFLPQLYSFKCFNLYTRILLFLHKTSFTTHLTWLWYWNIYSRVETRESRQRKTGFCGVWTSQVSCSLKIAREERNLSCMKVRLGYNDWWVKIDIHKRPPHSVTIPDDPYSSYTSVHRTLGWILTPFHPPWISSNSPIPWRIFQFRRINRTPNS